MDKLEIFVIEPAVNSYDGSKLPMIPGHCFEVSPMIEPCQLPKPERTEICKLPDPK
ncbi:MAG: hypothetical protein PHY48_09085 [Candidatus Cloacimonetes bacterium]|jgi:hypothetical protein|nr:hypothetical protein [Candidatus Cloacimonadota bacterium]